MSGCQASAGDGRPRRTAGRQGGPLRPGVRASRDPVARPRRSFLSARPARAPRPPPRRSAHASPAGGRLRTPGRRCPARSDGRYMRQPAVGLRRTHQVDTGHPLVRPIRTGPALPGRRPRSAGRRRRRRGECRVCTAFDGDGRAERRRGRSSRQLLCCAWATPCCLTWPSRPCPCARSPSAPTTPGPPKSARGADRGYR